jgi:hypothetical protein
MSTNIKVGWIKFYGHLIYYSGVCMGGWKIKVFGVFSRVTIKHAKDANENLLYCC